MLKSWNSRVVMRALIWQIVLHGSQSLFAGLNRGYSLMCQFYRKVGPAFWNNAINSMAVCNLRCMYFVLQDSWHNVSCISVG